MREVLSHPLGPLPWALSTADGSLRKTNKAALAKELQKSVPFADVIPQPSACMIDAMALVQRLEGNHKTFAEVAESLLCLVLQRDLTLREYMLYLTYTKRTPSRMQKERRGS